MKILEMDVLNRLRAKYNAITKSRNFKIFMKFGAPMFVFVAGGSLLMEEFQKVRSVSAVSSAFNLN
mgnify:CR=1 FL=1